MKSHSLTVAVFILLTIISLSAIQPAAASGAPGSVSAVIIEQLENCPNQEFTQMVMADWLVASAWTEELETSADAGEIAAAVALYASLHKKYQEMASPGEWECMALQMTAMSYFDESLGYATLLMLGNALEIVGTPEFQDEMTEQKQDMQEFADELAQMALDNEEK